jgi:hypothetical protein
MLLKDVMQVLPLLMPQIFVDQFVFIWGHEQCKRILGQFTLGTYYYLKDLKHLYFVFCMLTTLWERRPNIVHWQWTKQGLSKFQV